MIYIIKAGKKQSTRFYPRLSKGYSIFFKFKIGPSFLFPTPNVIRYWDRLFGVTLFSKAPIPWVDRINCDLMICKIDGSIMVAMMVGTNKNKDGIIKRMCTIDLNIMHYAQISHFKGADEQYYFLLELFPENSLNGCSCKVPSTEFFPTMFTRGPEIRGKSTLDHDIDFDISLISNKEIDLEVYKRKGILRLIEQKKEFYEPVCLSRN